MQKQSFGERINNWLEEPSNEIFRHGKWRFWFPTLIGLTALNAVMTAVIFGADGMQKYIGSIVVLAGAVLCWLALGLLHYSDSDDRLLAIGVAALDSITLLFVAAHFSFLLYCQGHLWTLRAAEDQHRTDMAVYINQWSPVRESNDRIAATVERIAGIEKETERLRNDTAYWSRRNGVKQSESGIKFDAKLTPVDVPSPPKVPAESSAAFLSQWDSWIRLAGFGELALSIITLIFVRTRSAARNQQTGFIEFPSEIETWAHPKRFSARETTDKNIPEEFRQDVLSVRGSEKTPVLSGRDLRGLRRCLRDVAHYLPKQGFKADISGDGVIVRQFSYEDGEKTIHSVKFSPEQCEEFLRLRITKQFQFLAKLGFAIRDDITRYVYFIRRKGTDEVKIGVSNAPENRLLQLQGGQGQELELVQTLPGNEDLERRLHEHFKNKHLTGEWFNLRQSDIDSTVKKIKRRLASGKPL
jgi:hypothetical protein